MTGRLVHTGQVVVDQVMRVDHLPARGGDVLADSFQQTAGGGFNVMAAARRAGAAVLYAGSHGIGVHGDLIRTALAAEGIEVAHPPAEPDSGVCVVLVEQDGERTFVTSPDALGHFAPVASSADDIVYVTGYSLLHDFDAVLSWLSGVRGTVLLDPGPLSADISASTWDAVLPRVGILSCGAAEDSPLFAGVPVRIVRDGSAGCRFFQGDGAGVRVPGFPVTAVDTNGAGDAHCGVLAAELLLGADLITAATRANAAAALSVTRRGPATSPSRVEVDAFLLDRF